MAREINDKQQFSDKLVKFIPTEIVGAYMVLSGIIGFVPLSAETTADKTATLLIQIVFFVLLALTPVYLWRVSNVRYKTQLFISTVSFAVWVYTLGGPFSVWGIYDIKASSVVLILWSLIPPLLVNPEIKADQPATT